jgi:hypothetical protein
MKWSVLTNPPRPQKPPKKAPLFTTKFQSTKSFSPGHLVGAGILVAGVVGIAKLFIDHGKAVAEETRRQAEGLPPHPAVAQADNPRGHYGR